ncbi:hypothetical protein HPB50_008899 [Hyalomma asiaticum]|uniref:Uncharacterized protein n=1 Tax=Hyalomma asiaticum TaxID=266040 RepID=A0ACB7RW78_HYAAI|nr:hypothetical protein HPB50_008899 [Hyalomma asiaticum]
MAANQTGRVQELRHQLQQVSTIPHYNLPAANAGISTSALSYAGAAARGIPTHGHQQVIPHSNIQDLCQSVVAEQSVQPRQAHVHVMFLAPIVPSTSPANDVMKIIKTNKDDERENSAKEKIAEVDLRKTRNGLTVLTNDHHVHQLTERSSI